MCLRPAYKLLHTDFPIIHRTVLIAAKAHQMASKLLQKLIFVGIGMKRVEITPFEYVRVALSESASLYTHENNRLVRIQCH